MARLLLIDDDELVRTAVAVMLAAEGHHVETAPDGRSGVATLASGRFDLVLCDIFMPEMDGFETLRAVRRLCPGLPVVMMSGHTRFQRNRKGPDFLRMAVDLGAAASLSKPLDPAEVLAVVWRCLPPRPGLLEQPPAPPPPGSGPDAPAA